MNSFRQKIFISYLILLIVFLVLMFPFVTGSVEQIVFKTMSERADELIDIVKQTHDDDSLIAALKNQRHLIFFRVGILDDKHQLLYDSHTRRLLGPYYFPIQSKAHPEVEDAIANGIGYAEDYSKLVGQKLIYLAKRFDLHGKIYVIRLAFPYQYIQDLRKNFEIGFVLFSSAILILFSLMNWLILNHFTSPIRQIIDAIKPYEEQNVAKIPEIHLRVSPQDDFTKLANTLNALGQLVKNQIETLTNERNEKEAILESLAEGVLAVDQNLLISYANSKALQFLELDRNSIGEPFSAKIHERCLELLVQCQKDGCIINDAFQMKQNEKKLYINAVVCPREKERGAILVLQDKSIHNKILEMRKDFIANASHELKTPITIIRGFAETLQDRPNLDPETVKEVVEKIVRNCQRMTKIVKNLLTLADIENLPRFRIHQCNLLNMIDNLIHNFQSIYPHVRVTKNISIDSPFIYADEELLEVALMNILDNAAKYSKENPQIEVSVQKIPNFIQIQIFDNGIGIPEQDLENVFQRFYSVNRAHSKKVGGSGLGLSIVQTIVEKHFGKISVSSKFGHWTKFSILLTDDLEARLDNKIEQLSFL